MNGWRWLLTAVCGVALTTAAAGELQSGDITLHYNALTAQALPASAAARYGLPRDLHQGLLVIVATRGGNNLVLAGAGHAKTLLDAPVPLHFKAIDDGGATLLVSFPIRDSGTVRFDLTLKTADGMSLPLVFSQDFVVD